MRPHPNCLGPVERLSRPLRAPVPLGDHLYRMDYMDFVQKHRETGADITVSALPMDNQRASDFGLMKARGLGCPLPNVSIATAARHAAAWPRGAPPLQPTVVAFGPPRRILEENRKASSIDERGARNPPAAVCARILAGASGATPSSQTGSLKAACTAR